MRKSSESVVCVEIGFSSSPVESFKQVLRTDSKCLFILVSSLSETKIHRAVDHPLKIAKY